MSTSEDYVIFRPRDDRPASYVKHICTHTGLFWETSDPGDALKWASITDLIRTLRETTVRADLRVLNVNGWRIGKVLTQVEEVL